MRMDSNTFWILFWIIIFTYFGVNNYINQQTIQMKIKTQYQIKKMHLDSNKELINHMKVKVSN